MGEKILKTFEFGGIIEDATGKYHHVRRSYCPDCGILRGETHHGCCGYASNGWMASEPCANCKKLKEKAGK